jgi:hypothetical protein
MGRSGGGGGGGGGFSGGFSGGGRSSGGFSGGGGGFGGGRSGGPGGGFGGGPRPGGPAPMGGGHHHHSSGGFFTGMLLGSLMGCGRSGGGGQMPSGGGNNNGNNGGGGGLKTVLLLLIACIVLVSALSCVASVLSGTGQTTVYSSVSTSSGTASTIERTALPAGSVDETAYYEDVDGTWIASPSTLEKGMRQFYMETGVQPYLIILPNGQTTSTAELSSYAQEQYDQLFTDEAHFLVVFCDNGRGSFNVGYTIGSEAKTVMDSEAISIFQDYLDRYYSEASTESEMFADAFSSTADRIMTTDAQRNAPVIITVVVVVGVIVVVLIVALVLRKRRIARAEEQKRTQEILNTPLEKFGDTEVENLAKKYEEDKAK